MASTLHDHCIQMCLDFLSILVIPFLIMTSFTEKYGGPQGQYKSIYSSTKISFLVQKHCCTRNDISSIVVLE